MGSIRSAAPISASDRVDCPQAAGRDRLLMAGSSQRRPQTRRRKPVIQLLAEATTGCAGRPTGSGRLSKFPDRQVNAAYLSLAV